MAKDIKKDTWLFQSGKAILNNALSDSKLMTALAGTRFDRKGVQGALEHHKTMTEAIYRQAGLLGEKLNATERFQTLRQEAKRVYARAVKLARLAFTRESAARDTLMLKGRRSLIFSNWLEQARTFYANLLKDQSLCDLMAQFGYGRPKLTADFELIGAVEEAFRIKTEGVGKLREATAARNEAIAVFRRWLQEFKVVCEVHYDDDRGAVEMLGFTFARRKTTPGIYGETPPWEVPD
jgi:hypothetical protein